MRIKHRLAAAVLAGAVFSAVPAAASVTITGISGNPGFQTGRIIYTPGGIGGSPSNTAQNLYIGRIRMTGISAAFWFLPTFGRASQQRPRRF